MMSSWEAESMAVSNKENNALTLTRLRRVHRCPQHRPGSRPRHVAGGEPDQNRRLGASAQGAPTRASCGGRLTPPSPCWCTNSTPPLVNPKSTSIKMKTRSEHEPRYHWVHPGPSGSETQHISPEFLCLVQAARHVQTPDNLPLCLTLSHPSPHTYARTHTLSSIVQTLVKKRM